MSDNLTEPSADVPESPEAALRLHVAQTAGYPQLADRLRGTTAEELAQDLEHVLGALGAPTRDSAPAEEVLLSPAEGGVGTYTGPDGTVLRDTGQGVRRNAPESRPASDMSAALRGLAEVRGRRRPTFTGGPR